MHPHTRRGFLRHRFTIASGNARPWPRIGKPSRLAHFAWVCRSCRTAAPPCRTGHPFCLTSTRGGPTSFRCCGCRSPRFERARTLGAAAGHDRPSSAAVIGIEFSPTAEIAALGYGACLATLISQASGACAQAKAGNLNLGDYGGPRRPGMARECQEVWVGVGGAAAITLHI